MRTDPHARAFLPQIGHWTPHLVVNQDGSMMAGYHLAGLAAELAGARAIIAANLRDNQLDQDSLPPYPELDKVLEAYVELDRSREELLQEGFDPDVVERALALIDRAEYKRRQAPPGVKLRPKAFGRDRRTPITNRWRG